MKNIVNCKGYKHNILTTYIVTYLSIVFLVLSSAYKIYSEATQLWLLATGCIFYGYNIIAH